MAHSPIELELFQKLALPLDSTHTIMFPMLIDIYYVNLLPVTRLLTFVIKMNGMAKRYGSLWVSTA